MARDFKRSFMHSTRRKLADMVHTGTYEKDSVVGWTKVEEHHEIGDVWEDVHHRYEQFDGYVLKASKNTEALQEVREYLKEQHTCKKSDCSELTFSKKDIKIIKHSGYCINCLSKVETEIRHAGIWKQYQNYKIWTRMLIHGKLRLEQLKQAHDEAKQVHEFLNEDGSFETWTMPQSVEEVKADMLKMIEAGNGELEELEKMRTEAFDKIKGKNCEHYI